MNDQINLNNIITPIFRIIEGAMGGDKEMIRQYAERLAVILEENDDELAAKCIREKIYGGNLATMDYTKNSSDIISTDKCPYPRIYTPSCWKEGEHDKKYNGVNTSASIETNND